MKNLSDFVKVLSIAVIPAFGAMFGVFQYLDGKNRAIVVNFEKLEQDTKAQLRDIRWEAQKPFLRRQMELCFEASAVASTLATSNDQKVWTETKSRFYQLYWGELAIVEDIKVETQMVKFERLMQEQNPSNLPAKQLAARALQISHACRALISASWEIPLEELTTKGAEKPVEPD